MKTESDRPEFDGQYQLPILIPSALLTGSVLHAGAVHTTNSYSPCPDLLAIAELGAGIFFSFYSRSPGMYDESFLPVGVVGLLLTNARTWAIVANLLFTALHGAKAFSICCKQDSEVVDQRNELESASPLLGQQVSSNPV